MEKIITYNGESIALPNKFTGSFDSTTLSLKRIAKIGSVINIPIRQYVIIIKNEKANINNIFNKIITIGKFSHKRV